MSTSLLSEYVLPIHEGFTWSTNDKGYHRHYQLYFREKYSGIRIVSSEVGAYLVVLGERIILEATTIRQAQASAQEIGEALRDKLPISESESALH